MKKSWVVMTFSLALLAMGTMLLTFFALQDIYNTIETDLTAEWMMVGVNFMVWFVFIIVSMMTLFKTLKVNNSVKQPEPDVHDLI